MRNNQKISRLKSLFLQKKEKTTRAEKILVAKKIAVLTIPTILVVFAFQIIASFIVVVVVKLIGATPSIATRMFFMSAISSLFSVFFFLKLLPKIADNMCKKIRHKQDNDASKNNRGVTKVKAFFATNREEIGLSGLFTWTDILIAPIALILSNIVAGILLAVFSLLSNFNPMESQDIGIRAVVGGLDIFFSFMTIVIIPAFFEEFIFRGWIYGKLRKFLSFLPAALISSILFGIAHGQANVALVTFAIGMTCCLIREFTGTIYAGILVHMLKNGIAYYILFFAAQSFLR